MTDQRLYQIGLTMVEGVGDAVARHLIEALGDAESIFRVRRSDLAKLPGVASRVVERLLDPEVLRRAERELRFVDDNHIQLFYYQDPSYPERLRQCPDAPVLFYFKGEADLSAAHVLSIVGTRHATAYGKELTDRLIEELAARVPDLLVVSGLAYGIDICAHRAAVRQGLATVGVLAHGLDRIYPAVHRSTAVEMLHKGGLLTDFPTGTNPDRPNFVRRNRIVAGLSEATLVVESATKGGSLITADLAVSYSRDVLAFPGRVGDPYSAGCNQLIRQNKAALISNAEELIETLSWDVQAKRRPLPQQTQLLFDEADEAARILRFLAEKQKAHLNEIAVAMAMPISQLSTILFELELQGKVKTLPGSVYIPSIY